MDKILEDIELNMKNRSTESDMSQIKTEERERFDCLRRKLDSFMMSAKIDGYTDMDIKKATISFLYNLYHPKTEDEVKYFLSNPPNHVLNKLLPYFQGFNGFENLEKQRLKDAIVTYLLKELKHSKHYLSMDVEIIIDSGWENNALDDTCPRDQILSIIGSQQQNN